jgi:acetyl esterase/lipase
MPIRTWTMLTSALAVLLTVLSAQSLRPADVDKLPSKPADARIQYGADPLQFGDLRLPPGKGPFALAVIVHGGCWVSSFASVQNTAALSDALRDAGLATWNVEYRRLDDPGGGWPNTLLDVAAGADHVRMLAAKYPLDLEHVVAAGHSAGGHLALWLAARPRLPQKSPLYRDNPLRVSAAVALGGPGDLRDFNTYAANICGSAVVERLLGGAPAAVPDRYAQASPAELLPFKVPQLLIVGDRDPVMPAKSREAYVAAARKAGDTAEVVVVANAGHFEVIAPTSAAWTTVRDQILKLVVVRP